MKILVVGLGSMGKRRIRLIKKAYPDSVVAGVDSNAARREEGLAAGACAVYDSVDAALAAGASTAFVCTSPLSHKSIIDTCLDHGLHVFTEINLVSDGYRELVEKAHANRRLLFLSSTFLYRRDIQYIIQAIGGHRVNYRYHCGQHLTDWHPWESYKDFFVSDRRTNGCREIFAIDLPWLLSAMGEVSGFTVQKGKISHLEIPYNDYYFVGFTHRNGSTGNFCADIVSRHATRSLEVFSEDIYLTWEGTPGSLKIYNFATKCMEPVVTYQEIDKNSSYSDNIIENAYTDEILAFFDLLQGKGSPLYTFEKDLATLELIDRIETEETH